MVNPFSDNVIELEEYYYLLASFRAAIINNLGELEVVDRFKRLNEYEVSLPKVKTFENFSNDDIAIDENGFLYVYGDIDAIIQRYENLADADSYCLAAYIGYCKWFKIYKSLPSSNRLTA